MKRAAFLICAGTDTQRFKVLQHRGQIPFVREHDGAYSLREAFLMRCQMAVMTASIGGLGPREAARFISNAASYATERYGPEPRNLIGVEPAVWLLGLSFCGENTSTGEAEAWWAWHAGPLHEQAQVIARELADDASTALRNASCTAAVAVNATRAAIDVITKAEELGVTDD